MKLPKGKPGESSFVLRGARHVRKGFTLIELLVVVGIISLLISILYPVANSVRRKVSILQGIANQRSVATSLDLFANDNSYWYPPSIATAGEGGYWNWTDPRLMVGYPSNFDPRMSNGGYRSMSAYLNGYVEEPRALHCTNVPADNKFIEEAWNAGDDWDNPDRIEDLEPMTGSYCFWWGYRGVLTDYNSVFMGPVRSSGGRGQAKVLLSDYFGSNTYRNWDQYGSCESFKGGIATGSNSLFTDFYSGGSIKEAPPLVKLNAAFTDGHVESYTSSEVVTMEVARTWDASIAFRPEVGKGKFYIPKAGMP